MKFLFWPQILQPKTFKVCWGWVSVLLFVLSFTFHFHSCGTSAHKEETFGLDTRAEFSLVGFESPTDTSVVLISQVLPLPSLLCCSLCPSVGLSAWDAICVCPASLFTCLSCITANNGIIQETEKEMCLGKAEWGLKIRQMPSNCPLF